MRAGDPAGSRRSARPRPSQRLHLGAGATAAEQSGAGARPGASARSGRPVSLSTALPVSTPPGASTRTISMTAPRGSGKQCSPVKDTTRSNSSVGERQLAHVGGARLHLVGDSAGAAASIVRSSMVGEMSAATYETPCPGSQAAQRDPAAAGDVEDPGTRLGCRPISAAASYSSRRSLPIPSRHSAPPARRVLDGPVVERRPERVVAPAAEGLAHPRERHGQPISAGERSISRGYAERVDQVDGERAELAAQPVDLAADRLGPLAGRAGRAP